MNAMRMPNNKFDYSALHSFTDSLSGVWYYPSIVSTNKNIVRHKPTTIPLVPYPNGPGMGTLLQHDDPGDVGTPTAVSGFIQGYDSTDMVSRPQRYPRGIFHLNTRPADATFVAGTLIPNRIGQYWNTRSELGGLPASNLLNVVYTDFNFFGKWTIDPTTFKGGEILVVMLSGDKCLPNAVEGDLTGTSELVHNLQQIGAALVSCKKYMIILVHYDAYSLPGSAQQINYETIFDLHVATMAANSIPYVVRTIPSPANTYISDGLYTTDITDFFGV